MGCERWEGTGVLDPTESGAKDMSRGGAYSAAWRAIGLFGWVVQLA